MVAKTRRPRYKAVFTLVKFSVILPAISPAISCLPYLPWPIEMILSMLHCPRWPRQVKTHVAVAGIMANKCHQCK